MTSLDTVVERKRAAQRLRWIALVGAVSFLVLLAANHVGLTRSIDLAVALLLVPLCSEWLDRLTDVIAAAGELPVSVAIASLLAIALWRASARFAWLAPLLIVLVAGIELVARALPATAPVGSFDPRLGDFPPFVFEQTTPTFPSGHVARATFLAVLAVGIANTVIVRAAASGAVALMVFTRLYQETHFFSDTLGGVALGASVGSVAVLWLLAAKAHRRGPAAGG